jgi:hypothetical protein
VPPCTRTIRWAAVATQGGALKDDTAVLRSSRRRVSSSHSPSLIRCEQLASSPEHFSRFRFRDISAGLPALPELLPPDLLHSTPLSRYGKRIRKETDFPYPGTFFCPPISPPFKCEPSANYEFVRMLSIVRVTPQNRIARVQSGAIVQRGEGGAHYRAMLFVEKVATRS